MATEEEIQEAGIILREDRTYPLTHGEMDGNFVKILSKALEIEEVTAQNIDSRVDTAMETYSTALTDLATDLETRAADLDTRATDLEDLANQILGELPLPPAPLDAINGMPIIKHTMTNCNIALNLTLLSVANLVQEYTIPSCTGTIEVDMTNVAEDMSILITSSSEFTAVNTGSGREAGTGNYSHYGVDVLVNGTQVVRMVDHPNHYMVSQSGVAMPPEGYAPLIKKLVISGIPDGEFASVMFVRRLSYQ